MSGDTPLISVVMATYNHEKYIAEAIQSILDQTFTDFELVIVNDGSTDRTDEIVKTFKDARIIYISQHNQGPSVAINNGFLAARGKYIAYLDGDDVAYPNRLERQYNYISKTNKKVAVFSWVDFIDDESNIITEEHFASSYFNHPNKTFPEILNYFVLKGNYLNACTNIIEKEVLLDVGLYHLTSIQIHDFDLWIKLFKKGYEFFIMPEKLIKYRIRAGNKNLSGDPDNQLRGLFEMHQLYRNIFDGIPPDLFREAFWNQIRKKDFNEGPEYELEKAFLYLHHSSALTQSLAAEKLFSLLQDRDILSVAISEYGFGLLDLYKLTKEIDPTNTRLIWQIQAELAQANSQLHLNQKQLEQFQAQLHQTQEQLKQSETKRLDTESLLEQSQAQLYHTQEQLEQSQAQLHHNEKVGEQFQEQLHQSEKVLEQLQAQLYETQEQLEQSQAQLYQNQAVVEQFQEQLHQSEEVLEQLQVQLSETQEQLEQSQTQLHQKQAILDKLPTELHETQQELNQSQAQFHETKQVLKESQSQLHQAKRELEQLQVQTSRVNRELEESQSKLCKIKEESQSQICQDQQEKEKLQSQLHKADRELKRLQSQLYQIQGELEQSQSQVHQLQGELERSRFVSQAITREQERPSLTQYELLVWEAWYAYHSGELSKMKECLQESLKFTPFPKSETILNWLEGFSKFSLEKKSGIDIQSLTNLAEWKQLMRQAVKASR